MNAELKANIRKLVEETAKTSCYTPAEILSRWQGELAKQGNEEGIGILHDVKMEYQADHIKNIMER